MSNSAQPLEAAWQTLRSSLDCAEAFGLVFLFSDDARAKQALFERANDWMQAQVRPFQRPVVAEAGALATELLPLAVNPTSQQAQAGMPLWLDLDAHPGVPEWDEERRNFLLRLNERRATLMRVHPRTVVLALPLGWTKPAAEAAPDLWTIRQPSVYLAALQQQPALGQRADPEDEPVKPALAPSAELPAAVRQWQAAQADPERPLSAWSAARAAEAALEHGHLDLAWQIANQSVMRIRAMVDASGRSAERLHDLSVSLNKLGDVASALGRLDEAQRAYAEGETLSRALIEEFGRTPERLRGLSISLERLGDVASALGRLDEAQRAYAEGETLRRALIDEFGRTPERLRDLSTSLERLGDVAQAMGRLDEAQRAYAEGETLRRALIDEFGRTPERLRDVSISLERLGGVAQAMGRLDEAQRWFTAEIKTAEDLIAHYGESAPALEVLAYGARALGQTLSLAQQTDEAGPHLERARHLYQRLALALPQERRYEQALAKLDKHLVRS